MKKTIKTSKRNCVDILFADKGGVKLASPRCSEHLESKIDPLNLLDDPVQNSGNGSEEFLVGEGEEHREIVAARMVAATLNDKLQGLPPTDLSVVNGNTPFLLWDGEQQMVDNLEFIQRAGKLLARQGSLSSAQFDELLEEYMSSKMRSVKNSNQRNQGGKETAMIVPGNSDQVSITGIDWKRLDDAIYAYEADFDIEFDIGDEVSLQLAAEKAVATACVRREVGLPVTALYSFGIGTVCDGSYIAIPISSAVMLKLAGYCWENRDRLSQAGVVVDRQSPGLARATKIITEARGRFHVGMGRIELDALISNDLAGWLAIVRGVLSPRQDFIQRVARLIVRKGRLSAAQFEYWERDEFRRMNKAETGEVKGGGQVSAA